MNKGQDGKEVHHPPAGLEVVPDQGQKWAAHYQDQASPQTIVHNPPLYSENDKEALASGPQGKSPLRSKRQLWLAIAVILLIVIAAVLGAVLGTTLHHEKKSSSNPASTASTTASTTTSPAASTATASATTRPRGIREKSPLAVTGWLTGDDYSIRVVFQNDDNMIQYTAYESGNKTWKQISNITNAKPGTPIALTSFDHAWYSENQPSFKQVEMFFLDSKNQLNEWNWDSTSGATGHSGSLTPYTIPTGSNSHITSFWPYIVYQDVGLALHEIVYDCTYPGCWSNRSLNVTGYDGTGIVILPEQQNMQEMDLIYQSADQRLMSMARNSTSGSFSSASTFGIDLPAAGTFAALTVVRPSSSDSALNTYILYQDGTGTIQVIWKDDDSSWKGPATFPAFANADNGTSIACMTQAAFFENAPLQADSPLSRCYFQVNGALREIRLDGSDWEVVGNVNVVP